MMDKILKDKNFQIAAAILTGVLLLKFLVSRAESQQAAALAAAESAAVVTTTQPAQPAAKQVAATKPAPAKAFKQPIRTTASNIQRVRIDKNVGQEMASLGGYSALPARKITKRR